MKKIIFFLLGAVVFTIYGNTTENPTITSSEAKILSQDAQFTEAINMIINFSVGVVQNKKLDALNKYVENNASESDLRVLKEEAGNSTDLSSFFQKIVYLRKSVIGKYEFMLDNEKGKLIVSEAIVDLSRKGKISKIKDLDVDCLASYAAAVAVCWWAYDQCTMNGGSDCIGQQMACFAIVAIAAQQCLGIIPD
jgi:hypothetical protein